MLPMRSIVLSKSKPWNMPLVEVLAQLRVAQEVSGCSLAEVLAGGDEEAARCRRPGRR